MKSLLIILLTFIFSFGLQAERAAKVIILKGKLIEYSGKTGKKGRVLKKGDWIEEGSVIRSAQKSFGKLLFIDKSQMSISSDSMIKIKEFPKNRAGIISLIKGKIRSKVTKNYMNIDKEKSKLFIKTKTAAMGVRGTDFQVTFNPNSRVTSLLTFEGSVAMAKIDEALRESRLDQNRLESFLNSSDAVMVKRGQYSGSRPNESNATIPVKISPIQLENLEKNDSLDSSESVRLKKIDERKEKVVRSIVPPGIDAKELAAAQSDSVDKAIENGIGTNGLQSVTLNASEQINESQLGLDQPNVTAGGYLDEKSGHYIPPNKDGAYDPNANIYIADSTIGTVAEDGSYIPPEGMSVNDAGELIEISGDSRSPASINGSDTSSASSNSEFEGSDLADQLINDNRRKVNNQINDRVIKERAKVKFRLKN